MSRDDGVETPGDAASGERQCRVGANRDQLLCIWPCGWPGLWDVGQGTVWPLSRVAGSLGGLRQLVGVGRCAEVNFLERPFQELHLEEEPVATITSPPRAGSFQFRGEKGDTKAPSEDEAERLRSFLSPQCGTCARSWDLKLHREGPP